MKTIEVEIVGDLFCASCGFVLTLDSIKGDKDALCLYCANPPCKNHLIRCRPPRLQLEIIHEATE